MRHRHVNVHNRVADLLDVAAADGVLEQRVTGEHQLAVDDEADHVVGMARRRDRLDLETTRRQRARDDRQAELVLMHDVVGVRMCAQHVGRGHSPFPIDCSNGSSGAPEST